MWAAVTEDIRPSWLPRVSAACHVSVRYLPIMLFPTVPEQGRKQRRLSHYVNLRDSLPENSSDKAEYSVLSHKGQYKYVDVFN